jgi:hypothetical protein
MKVDRAPTDTPPRPAWTAPFRWLARVSEVALLRLDTAKETDPERADLWLMLMAGDPEGTWHIWSDAIRRNPSDDTRNT